MENALKTILERKGMTQKELAEKLCVTPQAVSSWVNGKSRPSVDNVMRIDSLLGINLIKETQKNEHRRVKAMKPETLVLSEIDSYDKARNEATNILSEAQIETKYSHAVYILCEWLLTAVIGLTYHQMIHNKDEDYSYRYQDIFVNLQEYYECYEKATDCYDNYLEYSFYLMGMDLFESFDEYKMKNHDYCENAMNDWYVFCKAIQKNPSSPIYSELLVAIAEIISLN